MSIRQPLQVTISDRLDRAIAMLGEQGLTPRVAYLTPADYEELHKLDTSTWREQTGSEAEVWPLAFKDVPLINEKLIERVGVPVYQRIGVNRLRSAVYSTTGQSVALDYA